MKFEIHPAVYSRGQNVKPAHDAHLPNGELAFCEVEFGGEMCDTPTIMSILVNCLDNKEIKPKTYRLALQENGELLLELMKKVA